MKLTNRMPFADWVFASGVLALALCAAEEPKPAEPPKPARQQLKAERVVPDNVFLYIATPDLRKARSAFERTAFHALLQEDEVSQPVVAAFAKLREAFIKGDGTRSEADMRCRSNQVELLLRVAPLLGNQVALAVEGDVSSLLTGGTLPPFLLVSRMPADEEGEAWHGQLEEAMKKHLTSQCIDPHFRDSEDNKVGNYYVSRIENGELGVIESWAFVENLFLYGQGKQVVEDAIERFKNRAGTLEEHAGYQDAYKQAGRDEHGEALVYLQADIRPLLKHFVSSYPALQKVLDSKMAALEANRPHFAMGVHSAEGANAAIKEKILLRLNKEALPKSGGPCEGVSGRFAQNDALLWCAQQANLADLYAGLVANLKPSQAEAAAEAEKADPLQLKLATRAQNDADLSNKLGLFKGELAVFMNYAPQPNLKMDNWLDYVDVFQPVFALELDRENAVADSSVHALLATIQESTGHAYVPTTVATAAASAQIFYQVGAVPPEVSPGTLGLFRNLASPSESKPPFFTAHARVDLELEGGKSRKFLLLSESVEALKTAIRVAQPKFSHASLAEDKRLKDLTRSFRESRSSISYLDLKRLTDVYKDVLPKLTRTGVIRRQLADQLPAANVLKDHLFPMAWATSVITDPDGLLAEFSSPMGNLPMVGVIGAVAWPVIVEKQQEGVSDEVDDKFRHLKLALHLYAASFNRFPSQLSDLYPGYVNLKGDLKLRVFESPFKRNAVTTPPDIDNTDLTNLIYIPSRSLQDLGSSILLYEKEPTKLVRFSEGPRLVYHVLTLDDKKGWMTKAQLERTLSGKAELPGTGLAEQPRERRK